MEAEQDKQEESVRQSNTGPGEQLQAERIRKGLSLEDVANRMHLSSGIVEAIESNQFEEITAPIFVKGYLRAYARIVSLDEDDMIQQYLDLYSEEDPPINSTSNTAPELSAGDTRVKWTTYLVILLLAVLLGAWWWNKQQNQELPVSLDVQAPSSAAVDSAGEDSGAADTETVVAEVVVDEPAVEPADDGVVASEVMASSESAAAEPEAEPATVEEQTVEEETQAGADNATGSTPEPAAEPLAEAEPVVVEAVDETVPAEVAAEPASEEATAAAAAETAPTAGTRERPQRAAPVGDDRLRIVVHADTWADVKDANNYQLEYNLLRAGNTVDFSGEAPFTVFLGNGHGVEVLVNDETIDFSSRIRNDNTARLYVGG